MIGCWHSDFKLRPTFGQILMYYSQPLSELLKWDQKDVAVDTQATVLGAPLTVGFDLYILTYRVCNPDFNDLGCIRIIIQSYRMTMLFKYEVFVTSVYLSVVTCLVLCSEHQAVVYVDTVNGVDNSSCRLGEIELPCKSLSFASNGRPETLLAELKRTSHQLHVTLQHHTCTE
ncbi:uncharacterized protein LOC135336355 [Halichondria panicea]|uniref:uncharacterized protein LOC135336355 n=1 Tax=Halichondria panicea TaxID=6063 RepID=UPI00312BB256